MPLQPDAHGAAPGQLESVWISELHFVEDPDFDFDQITKIQYGLSYEIEAGAPEQFSDDDRWVSDFRFAIHVNWERMEDYEGPFPYELSLRLTGLISWVAEPPDDRTARSWVEYNGVHLLWPYARNYIATITGMSALPPLTIYTVAVPSMNPFDGGLDEGDLPEDQPSHRETAADEAASG